MPELLPKLGQNDNNDQAPDEVRQLDQQVRDQGNELNFETDHAKECEDNRQSNALYLLRFKEKGSVPQTVANSFVESATQIVQSSIARLNRRVRSKLETVGMNFENISEITELFSDTSDNANPFMGIDKEPLQPILQGQLQSRCKFDFIIYINIVYYMTVSLSFPTLDNKQVVFSTKVQLFAHIIIYYRL